MAEETEHVLVTAKGERIPLCYVPCASCGKVLEMPVVVRDILPEHRCLLCDWKARTVASWENFRG